MLVLSRNPKEQVAIMVPPSAEPTVILVTLVDTRGIRARIGFDAEKEVIIHRREVYESIQRQQEEEENGSETSQVQQD